MQTKLYVLPTREDQFAFDAGTRPRNCFVREFDMPEAAHWYLTGLRAGNDGNVIRESYLEMTVVFGESEDEKQFSFNSVAEKGAFRQGLEDGDGFADPLVVFKDSEKFHVLESMYASAPEQVFILCEEGSMGLLKSFGARLGSYDSLRRGVMADVSAHTLSQIRQFPADFEVESGTLVETAESVPVASEVDDEARSAMLVFLRHVSAEVTTVGMLSVKTSLATDAEVMAALIDATTEWVKKTDAGRKLWARSSEDLNIGDLAASGAFSDALLLSALLQRGVRFTDCTVSDTDEFAIAYDTVLVDTTRLEDEQAQISFAEM